MDILKTAGAIAATGALAFTLAGCSSDATTETTAEETAATATTATSESSATEAASEQQTEQAKYGVTLDGGEVVANYDGAQAFVITYTFTNNSDEAVMPSVAVDVNAYQNGVELDFGVVTDIDNQSTTREIKPGASITCQQAYVLNDTSDVMVEVTELISFSDELLATATYPVA